MRAEKSAFVSGRHRDPPSILIYLWTTGRKAGGHECGSGEPSIFQHAPRRLEILAACHSFTRWALPDLVRLQRNSTTVKAGDKAIAASGARMTGAGRGALEH
jgi:hypothetical protein